jgi:heme peroxidase
LITNNPALVDQLLAGAAVQRSEEVDTLMIDDLRNFLFGPPGAGGLDLAALNIQRGRDVGLPDYRQLSLSHKSSGVPSTFSQMTSDLVLAQALSTVYAGDINNVDAWVGALAENHVPGTSVGSLIKLMLESQFNRLRDGDRLFYRGNAAELYTDGVLNPEIAAIIDLESVTLADIVLANTSIEHLQSNVFFVPIAGDFNGDGAVDAADFVVWRKYGGTNNVWADGDGNGSVGPEDLDLWRANYGCPGGSGSSLTAVPEPASILLFAAACFACLLSLSRSGNRRSSV